MRVVAFAGGVGGARLLDGLAQCLCPEDLTAIVNTGDDFVLFGLKICPDLDTVCYTLAGLENPETGWGRRDETWEVISHIALLDGPTWFKLGDRDLATHLERTRRLSQGDKLSEITMAFCKRWRVEVMVKPMTDMIVSTIVDTYEFGEIPFQEYFVLHQFKPVVKGFRFEGADNAQPAPGVLTAISEADFVVFCPSNPWVSLDPILSIRGIREALISKKVVAVSPIIGGRTVKGPAAKMFAELGLTPSAFAVADHYRDLLTGFFLDTVDADESKQISAWGIIPWVTDILMKTKEDRRRLARELLAFCQRLG